MRMRRPVVCQTPPGPCNVYLNRDYITANAQVYDMFLAHGPLGTWGVVAHSHRFVGYGSTGGS